MPVSQLLSKQQLDTCAGIHHRESCFTMPLDTGTLIILDSKQPGISC